MFTPALAFKQAAHVAKKLLFTWVLFLSHLGDGIVTLDRRQGHFGFFYASERGID